MKKAREALPVLLLMYSLIVVAYHVIQFLAQ